MVYGRSDERVVGVMAPRPVTGPAQLVLTASVARRYYIDGRSKVEIADEFGLSRFQVARLIESARSTGIVRIEISQPGVIDVNLSDLLQEALGLEHSVVVDAPEDEVSGLRRSLGQAAADLLQEILTPDDVLGLAWARSVSAMAGFLTRLPAIPIVQLTGALNTVDTDTSSIDMMREVARVSRGPAYVFYAPMVVRDAATARALRQHPEVGRAFDQYGSVTKAVAGIGLWEPGQSTVYDTVDDKERRRVLARGGCADISGVLVGLDGVPLRADLSDRMIGVDAAGLTAIPEVIAIPYGVAKVPAVVAALRSGIVDSLVTHTAMARLLLDAARADPELVRRPAARG